MAINDKEYVKRVYSLIEEKREDLVRELIGIISSDPNYAPAQDWEFGDNWFNYCSMVQQGMEVAIHEHEVALAIICRKVFTNLSKFELQLLWLNRSVEELEEECIYMPKNEKLLEDLIQELFYRLRQHAEGIDLPL